MNKKILAGLLTVLLFYQIPGVLASNLDSLISSRNELYYGFLDIKNNTSNFDLNVYKKMSSVLEEIVLSDNALLDSLEFRDKNFMALKKSLALKNEELAATSVDLETLTRTNLYLMLGIGLSLLLSIILLIVLINKAISYSILRKKINEKINITGDDLSAGQNKELQVQGEVTKVAKLKQVFELYSQGVINEEEFRTYKQKFLNEF